MFYKKGVLINFAIFIGKKLCWSLFLIKNSQKIWANMFFLKFVSPLFIITANFGNTNRSRKTFLKTWNVRIILEHFRCCHFVEVIAAICWCAKLFFKDMRYSMYISSNSLSFFLGSLRPDHNLVLVQHIVLVNNIYVYCRNLSLCDSIVKCVETV